MTGVQQKISHLDPCVISDLAVMVEVEEQSTSDRSREYGSTSFQTIGARERPSMKAYHEQKNEALRLLCLLCLWETKRGASGKRWLATPPPASGKRAARRVRKSAFPRRGLAITSPGVGGCSISPQQKLTDHGALFFRRVTSLTSTVNYTCCGYPVLVLVYRVINMSYA